MWRFSVIAVLASLAGCAQPADTPTSPAPVVAPKHLMSQLVYTQYGRLLKGLESEPSDSADWERYATHAALLTEAGEMLLRPGSVQNESWQIAASALQEGGSGTLAAIRAHDLAQARVQFEKLNDSCATCHKECGAAYTLPWK